tara:strand:- start:134 stop:385 length:252 start_codon:yes stop_codon:yes gene_type:complete
MKLLWTPIIFIIMSGCATTLSSSAATPAATKDAVSQASAKPATCDYVLLGDGTLLVSPAKEAKEDGELSNPVISTLRINAEYR